MAWLNGPARSPSRSHRHPVHELGAEVTAARSVRLWVSLGRRRVWLTLTPQEASELGEELVSRAYQADNPDEGVLGAGS